jgi:hypothetical protein
MSLTKYSLTDEHRARLPEWRDKWIRNAMSTEPMTAADREITAKAIDGIYKAANLRPPKRIVFVASPFIARFAGGAAAWMLHFRKHRHVSDAIAAATNAATFEATAEATYAAVHEATAAATYEATYAAIDASTSEAVDAATSAATRAETSAAIRAVTSVAVDKTTRAATVAAIYASVKAAVDKAVDAATYAATYAATSIDVDAATAEATYAATVAATAEATAKAVDAATSAATRVDLSKWFVFDDDISWMSRSQMECAQKTWRMWQGGNQWSASDSFLSFFDAIVGLNLPEYVNYRHWDTASLHSGPRIMHEDFCIVSDRPEILLVDEDNRPHCNDGPFCRWRDGSALYAVHGVRVPAWIIEQPETITIGNIDSETNAEVRRVMIDKYGRDKYMRNSGAVEIHRDEWGILYRKHGDSGEPIVMVVYKNSHPEPDGSVREYWHPVHPELRPLLRDGSFGEPQKMTAHNAIASTFGLRGENYNPVVQT